MRPRVSSAIGLLFLLLLLAPVSGAHAAGLLLADGGLGGA